MDKAALWSSIALFSSLIYGDSEIVLITGCIFAGIIIAWWSTKNKGDK